MQCPNCGGYKIGRVVELNKNKAIMIGCLGFLTFGLGWLLYLPALLKHVSTSFQAGERVSCQLCGFKWNYDPNQPPVEPNPELIRLGEQRLQEQRESANRRNFYNQMHKR